MNNSQPYLPISCSFYDYLEEASTLGKISTIEYIKDNSIVKIEATIHTLEIKDKVEYMLLETGESIRLDYLLSFNGKSLPKSC
jgi:transcriptional antiterminator Rof (Rho-off)